jgi:hypothetical protein
VSILWTGVWLALAHRETGMTLMEFIKDISPYLLLATILCLAAHWMTTGISNIYLRIITKIVAVAIPYVAILWMLGSTILKEGFVFLVKRKIQ